MADPDATIKGLTERNTPGLGHLTEYRLDNVTIEVGLSEAPAIDESLSGMPMDLEGYFETREHPEFGTRPASRPATLRSARSRTPAAIGASRPRQLVFVELAESRHSAEAIRKR